MTGALTVLATVALGAVGALVRAEVGWWSVRRTGSLRTGTWLVNLVGAGVLGLVLGLVEQERLAESAGRVLGLGLLGGATTFSTWMVLIARPDDARRGRRPVRDVVVHGSGMLVAGVAAAGIGVWLAGVG